MCFKKRKFKTIQERGRGPGSPPDKHPQKAQQSGLGSNLAAAHLHARSPLLPCNVPASYHAFLLSHSQIKQEAKKHILSFDQICICISKITARLIWTHKECESTFRKWLKWDLNQSPSIKASAYSVQYTHLTREPSVALSLKTIHSLFN